MSSDTLYEAWVQEMAARMLMPLRAPLPEDIRRDLAYFWIDQNGQWREPGRKTYPDNYPAFHWAAEQEIAEALGETYNGWRPF